MSNARKIVSPTPEKMAETVAAAIFKLARAAIAARGRFVIALAGGSTPAQTYAVLARQWTPSAAGAQWFVFFSDERYVPTGDPASNYAMAQRCLLSRVSIPAEQVYAVRPNATAALAAAAYQAQLKDFFGGAAPIFDLILLGLGEDGHTASLFPGAAALAETTAGVVGTPPGRLPPPVDRITFTLPLINLSRAVFFLVCGAGKAGIVRTVLQANPAPVDCPAAGVQPRHGILRFYLDQAAASG